MNIAIVKLSSLGDIIHAMIVLQFIKKHHPKANIDWIVDKKFEGILEHHPDIRSIISLSIKQAKKQKSVFKFFLELRKLKECGPYYYVIDMQGLLKSAIITKLLKATHKVGFDKYSIKESIASNFYNKQVAIDYSENTLKRYLALLAPLGISVNSAVLEQKEQYVFYDDTVSLPHEKYIVFIVNSTWESRNYPTKQFISVANALKLPCYVAYYSTSEREKAEYMSTQSKYIHALPQLDLNALTAVIDNAVLLIGNDTGPTYIAYGVNTPSITLFGPTPANRIYPTSIHKTLKTKSDVNHRKLNKNDFSMAEIPVEKIVQTAQSLLSDE